MGKTQSRTTSGGTYILSGCVNARFWNSSEESILRQDTASDNNSNRNTQDGSTEVKATWTPNSEGSENNTEEIRVGFADDMCPFEVSLPPELGGSKCSVRVTTAKQSDSASDRKPPMSPTASSSNTSTATNKATVGALDCDISLDAASDSQDWCFTLYDFDGHQKVTKEDLSSLLKTISEALASSVTLPPSGSRKLKLSLSVVSDHDSEKHSSFPKQDVKRENASWYQSAKAKNRQSWPREVEIPQGPNQERTSPQKGKKNKTRRQRKHERSYSSGCCVEGAWKDEKTPSRRRNRNRKHTCIHDNEQNQAKGEVKLSEADGDEGAAHHPSENAERRNYYKALAGIENTSNSFTESDHIERTSQTLPSNSRHQHRSTKRGAQQRRSRSCERDTSDLSPSKDQSKRNSKLMYIESPGKKEGEVCKLQEAPSSSTRPKKCQTVQATTLSPYSGQPMLPNLALPLPTYTGSVTTKQAKHHRTKKHVVKPFTFMEHEIHGGAAENAMSSPQQHHHHHEHHHHYHHHYHYH